jgi:small ligand-binding sensory domain FIST
MTVATALISGNDPSPQLAEAAVAAALARAGLTRANGVLLFMTPDFSRSARHAVTAVARRAQCTQVAGGIAAGVLTEEGWALDRPAAAVMVFGGELSLGALGRSERGAEAVLSYCAEIFPPEWRLDAPRFGATFASDLSAGVAAAAMLAPAWQNSRVAEDRRCNVQIAGAKIDVGVSTGLQILGEALTVEQSHAYDVERIGGSSARDSLYRMLPATFAEHGHPHALTALLVEDVEPTLESGARPIAIVTANADGTVTLAERVKAGQRIAWAIRHASAAQSDMRACVDRLAAKTGNPVAALMFSCIGRGPYFYSGDDLDLALLRGRFAGLPIIGTYGTGQIASFGSGERWQNRELNNSVVTALLSAATGAT